MQLYLIRHGQSENNANIDSPALREPDPLLTEMGLNQSMRLAEYLRDMPESDRASDTLAWRHGQYTELGFQIHYIIVSPMMRALQTAKPLADVLGVPVTVWTELHERGGLFTHRNDVIEGQPGVNRRTLQRNFPRYSVPAQITDAGWWRGSMESRTASGIRAIQTAERLNELAIHDWRNKSIALISHAGYMDMLLKALLGQLDPEKKDSAYYFFYNTSLTRIDFFRGRQLGIRYLNRVAHLSIDLIS